MRVPGVRSSDDRDVGENKQTSILPRPESRSQSPRGRGPRCYQGHVLRKSARAWTLVLPSCVALDRCGRVPGLCFPNGNHNNSNNSDRSSRRRQSGREDPTHAAAGGCLAPHACSTRGRCGCWPRLGSSDNFSSFCIFLHMLCCPFLPSVLSRVPVATENIRLPVT